MGRVTGYLTLALGLVWFAAALLIRAELMAPGVQVVGDPSTAHVGARYNVLVTLHGIGGMLFSIALGLWLGALAAVRGLRGALLWVWPGLVLLVLVIAAILVGVLLQPETSPPTGVGWVLYPPLSLEASPGAILPEAPPLAAGLLSILPGEMAQSTWSHGFVILGSVTLAVTVLDSRALRWTFIGAALAYLLLRGGYVYAITAPWLTPVPAIDATTVMTGGLMALVAAAMLLTLALIALPRLPAAAYLAAGALIGVVAQQGLRLVTTGIDRAYHDTYYVIAHQHYTLSLLAIFAGFTALAAALRVRLPGWAMGLHAAALALALLMTFLPQSLLGLQGMPRRYVDYPEVFALWNRVSTIGTWAFAALALAGIAAMVLRRTRG